MLLCKKICNIIYFTESCFWTKSNCKCECFHFLLKLTKVQSLSLSNSPIQPIHLTNPTHPISSPIQPILTNPTEPHYRTYPSQFNRSILSHPLQQILSRSIVPQPSNPNPQSFYSFPSFSKQRNFRFVQLH